MKKLARLIQTYLLYSLPFVITVSIWSQYQNGGTSASDSPFVLRALWEVMSWNLMAWFVILILFLVTLLVNQDVRDQTLRRIANLKDRDEREEIFTGQAAKSSYISTMAIIIFLLFISVLQVNITRSPQPGEDGNHHGTVSLGIGFHLFDEPLTAPASQELSVFESKSIPLSKSALLLCVLLSQMISFNRSMRRQMEE